jgi:hypothetical protein
MIDTLCYKGNAHLFYQQMKSWLGEEEGRRLFILEDSGGEPVDDPRVQVYPVKTLLEQELALQKIAWASAFKQLKVVSPELQPRLEAHYLAAKLLASDATDFGVSILRHLKANLQTPLRRLSALEKSLQGVPAIVVGAGPSLEKNGYLLQAWQDKALLITAGNAIHSIKTEPSLAVVLDPHQSIGQIGYNKAPLCLQGRTHPETKGCSTGELLYFADAHFAFEPWLTESQLLNTGWTVGNGAVAVAVQLGCNPIILVGMDYCYKGEQKYAWRKEGGDMQLVKGVDASGKEVWTQGDWLLSVRWMEEMAAAHPEITFINATADGMAIGAPFITQQIPEPPTTTGVNAKWRAIIEKAPFLEISAKRWQTWRESLAAARWHFGEEEISPEGALARELLLEPLWNIWGPLFEREMMQEATPEKMEIQKRLFFNRVIEEHLELL